MSRVQVYGRRLTALILDSNTAQSRQESVSPGAIGARDSDDDDGDDAEGSDGVKLNREVIPFGDNGRARLTSIKCHRPK
jgi:hypothetical protein